MKRRRVLSGAGALGLLVVGWWWTRPAEPPEPSYQGRPLSAWLDDLHPTATGPAVFNQKSHEAVQAIGPAAIPALLRWIKAPLLPFHRLAKFVIVGQFGAPVTISDNREKWARAKDGFMHLGSAGAAAFPALADMAIDAPEDWQRGLALDALFHCDIATARQLATRLKSADREIRLRAIQALSRIRAAPGDVSFPAFEVATHDPDPEVRAEALAAIANLRRNVKNWATWLTANNPAWRAHGAQMIETYGTQAKEVLPDLEAHAQDADPQVRQAVASAIAAIQK